MRKGNIGPRNWRERITWARVTLTVDAEEALAKLRLRVSIRLDELAVTRVLSRGASIHGRRAIALSDGSVFGYEGSLYGAPRFDDHNEAACAFVALERRAGRDRPAQRPQKL